MIKFIIRNRTYFLSLALTILAVVAVPLHYATFQEAMMAIAGIGLVSVGHQQNKQRIDDCQTADPDGGGK